ncbi:MAG: hypothetical protein GEU95_08600 [Rhizobiales bacterium]|nr:hypothetical protein [Hyphomicrobiales bacterium]
MRSACRTGVLFIAIMTPAMLDSYPAAAVDPLDLAAPCSVFDAAPCTPSFCGVFEPWPCIPSLPSIGQGLRVTIASRITEGGSAPKGPVNSLRELYAALRACWEPPPLQEVSHGMQMSVRFSFKRTGEIVAPPRVTYTSSDADPETRRIYGRAIDAALERCTPMPFSEKMGAAIAGRPISIRFIDNRKPQSPRL